MKKTKLWLRLAFLSTSIIVITVLLLLQWSDTYSNTHYDRTQFYTEPNKNVLKMHYILKNPTKYDSFIFGSSRVGNLNPLKIQNANYYNMTYSEGIPKEHLLNIQLFLKKSIKIKNLLIGLDEFSYQVSFEKHQSQGLTKAYYLATNTNIISYYRELYLRFPLSEDRHHISKKITNKKNMFTINISNQENNYKIREKSFNLQNFTTSKHLQNKSFDKPTYYHGNVLKQTTKDIKAIKTICTNKDINCIFFINPIHHKTYEYTDRKLLKKFKKELASITGYYDFSLQNEISNNNRYWQETSHFTLETGNLMLNKMFHQKPSFKNFGIYIHKHNNIKKAQ